MLQMANQRKLHAGASYNALNRYRMALIGLFAVATALQMWAANVLLNLAGLLSVHLLPPSVVMCHRALQPENALLELFDLPATARQSPQHRAGQARSWGAETHCTSQPKPPHCTQLAHEALPA